MVFDSMLQIYGLSASFIQYDTVQQTKIRIKDKEQLEETCSHANAQIDDELSEAIWDYDEFYHGQMT
jgi:hypothetical protein